MIVSPRQHHLKGKTAFQPHGRLAEWHPNLKSLPTNQYVSLIELGVYCFPLWHYWRIWGAFKSGELRPDSVPMSSEFGPGSNAYAYILLVEWKASAGFYDKDRVNEKSMAKRKRQNKGKGVEAFVSEEVLCLTHWAEEKWNSLDGLFPCYLQKYYIL